MGRKKKPYITDVTIEAVAAEGNGLAHVDGKVLFVAQLRQCPAMSLTYRSTKCDLKCTKFTLKK